jgi:hypothetical protein
VMPFPKVKSPQAASTARFDSGYFPMTSDSPRPGKPASGATSLGGTPEAALASMHRAHIVNAYYDWTVFSSKHKS